jgi:hypothetical protein
MQQVYLFGATPNFLQAAKISERELPLAQPMNDGRSGTRFSPAADRDRIFVCHLSQLWFVMTLLDTPHCVIIQHRRKPVTEPVGHVVPSILCSRFVMIKLKSCCATYCFSET